MKSYLSTTPAIATGTLAATSQPTLPAAGDLLLRPWAPSDAATFLGAYQDPAIRRWHTNQPSSEKDVLDWFAGYRADWAHERAGHWAVTRASRGEVLGRIALGRWNFADGLAACAYWVLPAARGAGVASRALIALGDWAFASGFHRLYLDHSTRNDASCRVAVKAGFRLEGTQRSAGIHADGRHDMHLHARVRGDRPLT